MDNRRAIVVVAQIAVGLLLVYAVYGMSLVIVKKDKLFVDSRYNFNSREATKIVDGYIEAPIISNRVFNTINPAADSFVNMPRSFNRKGGAQFSYSFWLFLDDTSPENIRHKTILLRGDPKSYSYTATKPGRTTGVQRSDVLVQCPLIGFGPTYDTFLVRFNTHDDPATTMRIQAPQDTRGRGHNLLKLIDRRWVLLTFSFEDNIAVTDFEDGIMVRFYVNDILYHSHRVRSTLRQNDGELVLFPPSADSGEEGSVLKGARIGNLTYFNYALTAASVREIFEQGPPKHFAADLAGRSQTGEPLHISLYNKMDIYNS